MMETVSPLDTTNEQPNGKHSQQPPTESNLINDKAKRKSVSFVDEKLIMDALNSTSAVKGKPNGSTSFRYKPTNQEVREQQKLRAANGGAKPTGRGAPSPNGHPQKERYSNGHSKGAHKSAPDAAVNGAAKNPVIVYYNDPNTQIDVDQLLTTTPSKQPTNRPQQQQHPANVLAPQKPTNGHYKQNGHTTNGHHQKGAGSEHSSKYDDNWRQGGKAAATKHESHPSPKHKPTNGHGTVGGGGKPNGVKDPSQQQRTGGKTNGTSEKVTTPKSEPITIYYTSQTSSEEIEHNLKELQIKTNGDTKPPATNGLDKVAQAVPVADAVPSQSVPDNSSQANVINGIAPGPMEPHTEPAALGTGDQYDVISGGVPIASPTLPTQGTRHQVLCMLVSHPQHFYVKFVDAQAEAQLASLNQFYQSDEHIDLSVDVLKAGQYFAACRPRPSEPSTREWIRVQLLHVESPELINCLLIDEGCFGMFKLSDLQPLYNQFRSVPKQAIRASLAGVKPKEIDWLPKQALEFKNLVADRKFHTGEQQFDQTTFDEKQSLEIELYFTEQEGEQLTDKSVADIVVERDIASKK